jgi:hypothetical protein
MRWTFAVLSAALLATPVTLSPALAQDEEGDGTYSEGEIVEEVEGWLGISAETAADIVETLFQDLGRPNGYIKGGETSGAIGVGLRYGEGDLVMADGQTRQVYWQGPSVGWDAGGNASRVFTLIYDLDDADGIYQRFPGVEGSAYYVGGVGVNYQRRGDVTLAPMRAGVGLRLGANVGYLNYSRRRAIVPF